MRTLILLIFLTLTLWGCAQPLAWPRGPSLWREVCHVLDINPAQIKEPEVVIAPAWYDRLGNRVYLSRDEDRLRAHEYAHAALCQKYPMMGRDEQERLAQQVERRLFP